MTIIGSGKTLTARGSTLWPAKHIAERALQRIGAYSVNDTAADPEELKRALEAMEDIIAERAGTEECFWLRPATITQALDAKKATYRLDEFREYPQHGIAYVVSAWLRDPNGRDIELDRKRRTEYEQIPKKDTSGLPECVYIDRLFVDTAVSIYPVIGTAGHSLRLVVQTLNPSVLGSPEKSLANGDVAHGLPHAFQRWLYLATTAEIGDGPVRKLPRSEIESLEQKASNSWARLSGFANREKNSARRTKAWGV